MAHSRTVSGRSVSKNELQRCVFNRLMNETYRRRDYDSGWLIVLSDPYWNQAFAGIQIALDTSIIEQKNKQFTIQSVRSICDIALVEIFACSLRLNVRAFPFQYYESTDFQPFPYPKYVQQDEIRNKIPSIVTFVLVVISLILATPLISTIIEEKDTGLRVRHRIVVTILSLKIYSRHIRYRLI